MRGQRSQDADIDLGLAVSGAALELAPELTLKVGQTRTCEQIAAFCGVRKGTIQRIEAVALRKLKFRSAHLLAELEAA